MCHRDDGIPAVRNAEFTSKLSKTAVVHLPKDACRLQPMQHAPCGKCVATHHRAGFMRLNTNK
jgi:hypothetical protein